MAIQQKRVLHLVCTVSISTGLAFAVLTVTGNTLNATVSIRKQLKYLIKTRKYFLAAEKY